MLVRCGGPEHWGGEGGSVIAPALSNFDRREETGIRFGKKTGLEMNTSSNGNGNGNKK